MTDRISVNDMLIVTFTVAAAASMKEKIYMVVQDAYYETNQEYLWREAVRINSAEICTIDSFQAKFLREFFNLAGVSPDFTTLDDTERGAMRADILDDILERRYSKPTEEFMQMLELFGGEGENEGLKDAINELYDYLRAVPFRDNGSTISCQPTTRRKRGWTAYAASCCRDCRTRRTHSERAA